MRTAGFIGPNSPNHSNHSGIAKHDVSDSKHSFLKLFAEEQGAAAADSITYAGLPELCQAFQSACGWPLDFQPAGSNRQAKMRWSAPVDPGHGQTLGHLGISGQPAAAKCELASAAQLADQVVGLLGQLLKTEHALWQREADLAAAVPVSARADESRRLAERLTSILEAGASAVDAQAAGLYLLDEATSELKLRAVWGLPPAQLAAPARVLATAKADLEAMLGHVVVLDDPAVFENWDVPVQSGHRRTAICVPVASTTTILGTMWLFCDERREINDHDSGITEIVAGRLAVELERQQLLDQCVEQKRLVRQIHEAEQLLQCAQNQVAPLVDGWDIAATTNHADLKNGMLCDFFATPKDRLAVVHAAANASNLAGAILANGLRTSLRAHGRHTPRPSMIAAGANEALWATTAGDQQASLCCAVVEPRYGKLRLATAGTATLLRRKAGLWSVQQLEAAPLGGDPDASYRTRVLTMHPGDAVVFLNACSSVRNRELADWRYHLDQYLNSPARELADAVGQLVSSGDKSFAVTAIKRT